MKLLVKMKTVSFILWKKHKELFGQPNNKGTYEGTALYGTGTGSYCSVLLKNNKVQIGKEIVLC